MKHIHTTLLFTILFLSFTTGVFAAPLTQNPPTERMIVFNENIVDNVNSIYSMTPDGQDLQLLAQGDISPIGLFPTEDWILYERGDSGHLYRVNLDGTINEALTNREFPIFFNYKFLGWSADNSKIVIASDNGDRQVIVLIDPETKDYETTYEDYLGWRFLRQTPDKQWLLYTLENPETGEQTLYKMREDTSDQIALFTNESPIETVRWVSEDNQWLLVTTVTTEENQADLWRVSMAGDDATLIDTISTRLSTRHAQRHPLLVNSGTPFEEDLYHVNVEAATLELLMPDILVSEVVLMPDGEGVYMMAVQSLFDIFLTVRFDELPLGVEYNTDTHSVMSQSPDREWLLFYDKSLHNHYYVNPADGILRRAVVPSITHAPTPNFDSWSPDSQYLYFQSFPTGFFSETNLYRQGIDESESIQITDLIGTETIIGWITEQIS